MHLTTVSGLSSGNVARGLLSCLLGIAVSFVGIDRLSSYTRYTMGIAQLSAGFNIVPILIGTFAVSQIIESSENVKEGIYKNKISKSKRFWYFI